MADPLEEVLVDCARSLEPDFVVDRVEPQRKGTFAILRVSRAGTSDADREFGVVELGSG